MFHESHRYFSALSLLFIPSILLLLKLADFPEASDRALKTENGYEEGLTWDQITIHVFD